MKTERVDLIPVDNFCELIFDYLDNSLDVQDVISCQSTIIARTLSGGYSNATSNCEKRMKQRLESHTDGRFLRVVETLVNKSEECNFYAWASLAAHVDDMPLAIYMLHMSEHNRPKKSGAPFATEINAQIYKRYFNDNRQMAHLYNHVCEEMPYSRPKELLSWIKESPKGPDVPAQEILQILKDDGWDIIEEGELANTPLADIENVLRDHNVDLREEINRHLIHNSNQMQTTIQWLVACAECGGYFEQQLLKILRFKNSIIDIDTSDISLCDEALEFDLDPEPEPQTEIVQTTQVARLELGADDEKIYRGSERKKMLKSFDALFHPLELRAPENDFMSMMMVLRSEFPWMEEVINLIEQDIQLRQNYGHTAFTLPPILLHGAPGIGKTRFCARLAELSNLPFAALSVAGAADDRMLRGTGAGWSTQMPCFPAVKMAEVKVANPLLLVDELDKCQADGRNGNPLTTLLMFLEPENARAYHDECLMTNVDLSHINWISTANEITHIPQPLLSRFRVIETPRPKPEHVRAIIKGVRSDFARTLNIDVRFIPDPRYLSLHLIYRQ